MDKKEPNGVDACVIEVTPPLASLLTGKGAHPRDCTTTLYDEEGNLKDDGGTSRELEKSYWEHFVDPKQARELTRRLAIVESVRYVPGSIIFDVMEENHGKIDEE